MTITIKGLDELQRKLEQMGERAKELEKPRAVPLDQLLTPTFIEAHTSRRYRSADDWMAASGVTITTAADLGGNPTWENHVRTTTDFPDWISMLQRATAEFAQRKIFG